VTAHRVLVVEDDDDLRSLLTRGLTEEGFDVRAVGTGTDALEQADDQVDVLVVDIGLPDADGRDVCQGLRTHGCAAPVLFLSARDAVVDRLAGFSAGGDDYLTKPFSFDELVARVRALARRAGGSAATVVGDLRLDPVTHAITCGDREIGLTPTEFRLLAALTAQPDTVLRRRDLVRAGWPAGAIVHDNTLDQYVSRLRRKLRTLPAHVRITTAHGVGYRLH
jgi:DNA-binding response OmpR family regulator